MYATDRRESIIEYSKHWIKACLYRYLAGKESYERILDDLKRAKKYGITKETFQIIIDSLPFDRDSIRFREVITILRKDCN